MDSRSRIREKESFSGLRPSKRFFFTNPLSLIHYPINNVTVLNNPVMLSIVWAINRPVSNSLSEQRGWATVRLLRGSKFYHFAMGDNMRIKIQLTSNQLHFFV
jgi:hypothetical protein